MPAGPSIITSRASAKVSPTSAMRRDGGLGEIGIAERDAAHPFGAGARLAGAASAEHEPDRPGLVHAGEARQALFGPAAERPMAQDALEIVLRPGDRRVREPPLPP